MKSPQTKMDHYVILFLVLLLISNSAGAQYATLITGLDDTSQHGSCTFSTSNQVATAYVSYSPDAGNTYFHVLSNDLLSTQYQKSISKRNGPSSAVLDRYKDGYMVATLEDGEFYTYYLNNYGRKIEQIHWEDQLNRASIPVILALDSWDDHFVCFPSFLDNNVQCALTDIDKNIEFEFKQTSSPIPQTISLARDPLISGGFYALMGDHDATSFNNRLYHFTKYREEDWSATLQITEGNQTDQSLAVLKSGNIALVFDQADESTILILREPGEAGDILKNYEIVDSGSTKPIIKALSDGGFVVIFLEGDSLYYQLFDNEAEEFGPEIEATESEDPTPDFWNLCSSDDSFEFAVIYSIVDTTMSYKVAKHPIADPTPLTFTLTCDPNRIVFSHGGNTIDKIYVKKLSENSYVQIEPTMTGEGSAEVTLNQDDFDYEAEVEYVIFDSTNRYYTSVIIDHSNLVFYDNIVDNSCGCTGTLLKDEVANACAEVDDLEKPFLTANEGEDDEIMLALTLDSIEENNFFNEVSWSVSSLADTSDLEAFLATQTGLAVTIAAENLVYGYQYTFKATTDQGRDDIVKIFYGDVESEEAQKDDGFVVYNSATNYQFSSRLLNSNGQLANSDSQATSIEFRIIFPVKNSFALTCFEYGEVEDDVQKYECYGVRKVSDEYQLISLLCPRDVNTGSGVCTSTSVTVSKVSTSFVSSIKQGSKRILFSNVFTKVVLSREIDESSSQIKSFPVGDSIQSFSFTNAEYELDLDEIEYIMGPDYVKITIEQEDDDDQIFSNYDFTESAAPISMLIIGILFIVLTGLATGFSKSLENYSAVNSINTESGWIKTTFIMLITNHPLLGVYLFKSPTVSKFQASILYCSRAFAVMLFANVYNMVEFDTPRVLSSTENSEFTAGFLLLPYVTFLLVVFVLGVSLRGTRNPKAKPSQEIKIFALLMICILIVLSLIFTILIQKNMTEDQRTKANRSFGQAMFQDLIVTPILTLILYSILYHLFIKKGDGQLKSSKMGYVLVAESFQECIQKKLGISFNYENQAGNYQHQKNEVAVDLKTHQNTKKEEDDALNRQQTEQ